jgi:hypothetical protein
MWGTNQATPPVLKMYDTVDQVKVHKVNIHLDHRRAWITEWAPQQRCKHLRNQCVETLNALRDKSTQVEGSTELQEALDVFEGCVSPSIGPFSTLTALLIPSKVHKIHHKMEEWASLSLVKSVIRQSEISAGLGSYIASHFIQCSSPCRRTIPRLTFLQREVPSTNLPET